jgi:DNA modification methylase
LQADGWYLRQDIIWHKPNPMPESVRDRCTKAHEYIFLLSKSERYFFDSEAMKEPSAGWPVGGAKTRGKTGYASASGAGKSPQRDSYGGLGGDGETRNRRSVWTVATRPYKGAHFATFPPALIEPCILAGSRPGDIVLDPFMGSGTTAAVALQHGRQYLGCELNPAYQPLQDARIADAVGPLFA